MNPPAIAIVRRRRPPRRRYRDAAVSAVFGTMLMLALTASMMPLVLELMGTQRDALAAEREAAELAAHCARNPAADRCARYELPPGYRCAPATQATVEVLLCRREGGDSALPGTEGALNHTAGDARPGVADGTGALR